MNWGVAAADEKKIGAVIESTTAGRPLYEKCGFRAVCQKEEAVVGFYSKGRSDYKVLRVRLEHL